MFNRPPVYEVCPNHEVTKPWTGTSTDLGSVAYSYVAILYAPLHLLYLAAQFPPKGANRSCPSSHHIFSLPVCNRTGSSAHLGVPYLCPRIMKILHLPRLLLNKVLRSPEVLPSPSVFSIPPSPLALQCRNLLLQTPDINTTSIFLLPRPSHRQKFFYISPYLNQGSQRFPPPFYPISFSNTSYIGRNSNQFSTVVYRRLIYYPKVCVSVSLRIIDTPLPLFQVPYHCRCNFFPVTFLV